ncbi:hypothetical protein MKJ04_13775 [Pontibacter sp. E15-1]|uniref:hypothetical protein n=1 Tax=Pontibacter sp. E15-1 TaxID=2919918 RepID=UPI001F4F2D54|nr:hypothetical protein [Pontibacter sp. E15-1]MCJ8165915.1 hypothetical protein [Pontibacter sp. E15-1]
MAKIKKVNVLSFAKFQAILLALVGMICGIWYSIGGLLVDTLVSLGWVITSETPGLSYGTVLALMALLAMPALAAIAGFVLGLVEAILFNVVAKWLGGIELEFE